MRFVATVFLWLVTTVALAAAIPAMWAQKNIVDANGYAAFAQSAAKDPTLQQAMASELTTQIVSLASNEGYNLNPDLVRGVTTAYTQNAGFPGQFAQANRIVHTWMFTDEIRRQEGTEDRWLIDIAPMLSDQSLRQTLGNLNLDVPQTLTVPITVSDTAGMQPGQLRQLSTWGPWASIAATVITGVFALLTLAAARSRGKALAQRWVFRRCWWAAVAGPGWRWRGATSTLRWTARRVTSARSQARWSTTPRAACISGST